MPTGKRIHIVLPENQLVQLNALQEKLCLDRSEVIRLALAHLVQDELIREGRVAAQQSQP